jgi:hypothetical protein
MLEEHVAEPVHSEPAILAAPPQDWRARDQVNAMARRILAAWRGGAARILAPLNHGPQGFDAPALAWATLGSALEGRSFAGELHASMTATCLVAQGERGMLIVAWSDHPEGVEQIDLSLGAARVAVESVDGSTWSVSNSEGVHAIELTSTPILIRDADSAVVRLASSLAFKPPDVESRRGPQEIQINLENPFDFAVDGTLELLAPDGWSFEPSRTKVHMAAHGMGRVLATVRWERIPRLGVHSIPVRLKLHGDRVVDARIKVPVAIISPGLDIEADWSVATSPITGRESVIVTMTITNQSDVAIDLEATAVAWRVGRKRVPVSNLLPGERAVRRFQFNVGLDRLAGTEIRLSVDEIDGPAALSIGVPIGHVQRTPEMVTAE